MFLGPDQPIEFVLSSRLFFTASRQAFTPPLESLLTTIRSLTLASMVAEQTILNEWSLNFPTICVSVCTSVTMGTTRTRTVFQCHMLFIIDPF